MASRMNSGSSNDLNRIKIDPRTDEKFSFNVDIVAATGVEEIPAQQLPGGGSAQSLSN